MQLWRVLILDAERGGDLADRAAALLRRDGRIVEALRAHDRASFDAALGERPDFVLAPHCPGFAAAEALVMISERGDDVPLVALVDEALDPNDDTRAAAVASAAGLVDARNLWRLPTVVEGLLECRSLRDELRRARARFRLAFDNVPVGVTMSRSDGEILSVNPVAVRILGYGTQEEAANHLGDLEVLKATYVDQEARRTFVRRLRAEGLVRDFEAQWRRPSGEIRDVALTARLVPDTAGDSYFVITIIEDVSERVQQDLKIARLSRFRTMLSGVNSAIVRIRERDELLQEACRIAVDHGEMKFAVIALMTDRELRSVVWAGTFGDPAMMSNMVINVDDPGYGGMLVDAILTGRTQVDNDVRLQAMQNPAAKMAAELGYKSTIVLPLFIERETIGAFVLWTEEAGFFTDDEVRILEEMSADISFALESMSKAARVNYLAFYDSLTDLPNRNLFQERLVQTLRAAMAPGAQHKLTAVTLVNVERFRFVNETLGRMAGDDLLKQIAHRLRVLPDGMHGEQVQEIARMGSNSYGVVLRDLHDVEHAAITMKEILRQLFAQPFELQGHELRVRARGGIALHPSDGTDAEQLLRNAEAALASARSSAEAFLFYAPEMNRHTADVLALENKLRRAIELDQFVLHYQPKVSVIDRRITGVEALIRWQDPETGLVPPARFIPILEETGMIFEVGRWAMKRAIDDYKRWITMGLNAPRVAVNISPLQLRHSDFVAELQRKVALHGDAAVGLDLEITESVIMENFQQNVGKLRAISDLGINIAIDDFGTGYSSLSYLAKLPVAMLKIDRSFVVDMTRTPQGFAIVSTVIALAHSLNLRVVAEGVETEEQAKFLRVLNCDEIQGFLVSRPVPVARLEQMLAGSIAPLISGGVP